ncbi:MAG: hypothetical protein WCV50_06785 [Patescibacteria group bacterium]|jgi:type II secretory pathway pseudopilin PulG
MTILRSVNKGFTFVEVLLIIGILGATIGLAIPFYQSFQVASQLDNYSEEVAQSLRQAQLKAMASEQNSDYGLHFEAGQFSLFRGSAYSAADKYNLIIELPGTLRLDYGANQDIIFHRVSGQTGGVFSVRLITNNGKSKIININEFGVVNVQ